MGNAAICLVGRRAVRVVRPDGRVEEIKHKAEVTELMRQYPDYMVVHCSTSSSSLGKRSKISIMSPGEKLLPGRAYILYPIPLQYRQAFISLHAGEENSGKDARRVRKVASFESIVESVIRLLRRGWSAGRPLNEGSSPLLDSSADDTLSMGPSKEPPQPLGLEHYSWRPALEAIPESPYGYHDMPQSPFSFDSRDRSLDRSFRLSPRSEAPWASASRTTTIHSVHPTPLPSSLHLQLHPSIGCTFNSEPSSFFSFRCSSFRITARCAALRCDSYSSLSNCS